MRQNQIEWHKNKVEEISVKGFSQTEIAKMLKIPNVYYIMRSRLFETTNK